MKIGLLDHVLFLSRCHGLGQVLSLMIATDAGSSWTLGAAGCPGMLDSGTPCCFAVNMYLAGLKNGTSELMLVQLETLSGCFLIPLFLGLPFFKMTIIYLPSEFKKQALAVLNG